MSIHKFNLKAMAPLAAALGLLATPMPALAGDGLRSANKGEYCTAVASLAETIMRQRQVGVSIVEALRPAADDSPTLRDLRTTIVGDAYAEPAYRTEPMQARAITDFGAMFYVGCMKALRQN